MSRPDSGGFDLVLAISPEYLRGRLDALLPDSFTPTVSFDRTWDAPGPWNLDAHLAITAQLTLTIEDVVVLSGPNGPRIQVGATSGVWFAWDDVTLIEGDVVLGAGRWPKQGVLDGSDADELSLTATLAGSLTSDGDSVQITDLSAGLALATGSLADIPGIAALLAALSNAPDWLTPDRLEELLEAFAAWITNLPQHLADAITHALPASLPAVPLPFDDVRFTNVGSDVLALVSLSDTDGDPHAVVRTPIRRNPTGSPVGPLGLVIANDLILRTVRSALDLFLPDHGWRPPHPCHWRATQHLTTVKDIGVDLTWVLVTIDEAGAMRIDVSFSGAHSSGGFGLTGTATFAVTLKAAADSVGFTLEDPHLSRLDVWFAWWMYALMAVGGGPLGVLALGLLDAYGAGELGQALRAALIDRFPKSLSLPLPDTGLEPAVVSRVQPDAEWQFASFNDNPPMQLPISRAHDLILALVQD